MMSIREKLSLIVPRESKGSDTYRRYQFQLACAMELIVKTARDGKEFMALMDYLDDIVLIENPNGEDPSITFYQVKSKDNGNFTINTVLSNKWIEKMYYNLSQIEDDNAKCILLLNNCLSFGQNHIIKGFEVISLSEYIKDKKLFSIDDDILKAISQTFGIKKENVGYSNIFILRTSLTLDDYDRQLKGELHDFAKALYPTLTAVSLDTVFTKVKEMLGERQAFTIDNDGAKDYIQICEKKGFSSKQLTEILNATMDTQMPSCDSFNNFSGEMGVSFDEYPNRLAFTKEYNKFCEELIMYNIPLANSLFAVLDSAENDLLEVSQNDMVKYCMKLLDASKFGSSSFYASYKKFIVLLYLYKRSNVK